MNKNEKFVITINRELGSGGRTVGRKLAEKLGVKFYDKALIKSLVEKYDLTVEEIEKMKGRSHSWWAEAMQMMSVAPGVAGSSEFYEYSIYKAYPPTTDEMFETETKVLEDIAAEESCVVAGRSGFYVFRNHPNHLNIFIQATMPFRVERVMRKQNVSEDEARQIIKKIDEMRENYVTKYAGISRYDTRNYDLVITADGKSEDQIVDIIMQVIG